MIAKVRYLHYHNWRRHIFHSYLNYKSPKSLRRKSSFLALFAVSFPVFAAMATVFFYPRIFTGSVERRILLVPVRRILLVPVNTLCRTSIISSSTVLPLNLFVNLSLAPLSLFLTYGPNLGVWPGCWISAEFLRAPIPRKGSGSTTTTTEFIHPKTEKFLPDSLLTFVAK